MWNSPRSHFFFRIQYTTLSLILLRHQFIVRNPHQSLSMFQTKQELSIQVTIHSSCDGPCFLFPNCCVKFISKANVKTGRKMKWFMGRRQLSVVYSVSCLLCRWVLDDCRIPNNGGPRSCCEVNSNWVDRRNVNLLLHKHTQPQIWQSRQIHLACNKTTSGGSVWGKAPCSRRDEETKPQNVTHLKCECLAKPLCVGTRITCSRLEISFHLTYVSWYCQWHLEITYENL